MNGANFFGGDAPPPEAQKDFVEWLSANYPAVYEVAATGQTGFAGIFDNFSWGNFISGVDQALKVVGTYKTDQARIKINADRAQAGCAPISDWNAPVTPCTGALLNTGQIGAATGSNLDRYLPYMLGGGFLLAVAMLLRDRPRGRR